jgi:hypothetical protein
MQQIGRTNALEAMLGFLRKNWITEAYSDC